MTLLKVLIATSLLFTVTQADCPKAVCGTVDAGCAEFKSGTWTIAKCEGEKVCNISYYGLAMEGTGKKECIAKPTAPKFDKDQEPGKMCTANDECASGKCGDDKLCTGLAAEGVCVAYVDDTTDKTKLCGAGLKCVELKCKKPADGVDAPEACVKHSDCKGTLICADKKCRAQAAYAKNEEACTIDEDCVDDHFCKDKKCAAIPDNPNYLKVCVKDDDCKSGDLTGKCTCLPSKDGKGICMSLDGADPKASENNDKKTAVIDWSKCPTYWKDETKTGGCETKGTGSAITYDVTVTRDTCYKDFVTAEGDNLDKWIDNRLAGGGDGSSNALTIIVSSISFLAFLLH